MNAFISSLPVTSLRYGAVASPLRSPQRLSQAKPQARRNHSATMVVTEGMQAASTLLSENPVFLQKIASGFGTLGLPPWAVQYGHPALMSFMVLGMGFPGAYLGWTGRNNKDKKEGVAQKKLHENVILAFYLLAILGGSGGTLSVAMQGYDVWQSPHAISALVVLLLLGANSAIAYSGFTLGNDGSGKGRQQGRTLHAYFGASIMVGFLIHAGFGVKLLLG